MPDSDYARWERETYEPAVRRFPERKPSFLTESDLEVAPLYGPDAQDAEPLGQPGEFPFTRGVQPSMYRGRLWTMRQYAGFSTPEDSNARYRFLLSQGQTGPLRCVRPADADRLRRRPRDGASRDRQGGRPHIQPRGIWRRCSTGYRWATSPRP